MKEYLSIYNDYYEYVNPYKNFLPRERASQYVRKEKKIMRNDKCPCGSGKKFKSCCINKY